jgi:hypothetical protein
MVTQGRRTSRIEADRGYWSPLFLLSARPRCATRVDGGDMLGRLERVWAGASTLVTLSLGRTVGDPLVPISSVHSQAYAAKLSLRIQ